MRYLLVLLVFFTQVEAKSLSSIEETKALVESIMQDVGNNKMKDGLERMRPYIVFPISEFDVQMNNVDMQLPMISQRFGKAIGYDFVAKESLGDSIIQHVYLQKFEKHVMVWRFIFYKPKDEWLLNTFYFNDQIQALFKY